MTSVLVLGAGGEAGCNLCESLSDLGYLVSVVDDSDYARLLPKAHRRWSSEYLDNHLEHNDLIIPATSRFVNAITSLRRKGEIDESKLFQPDTYTIATCNDKGSTYNDLGQEWRDLNTEQAVAHVGDEYGYPYWMRARRGSGAKAALKVTSKEQALAWWHFWRVTDSSIEFMAEPYHPGNSFSWAGILVHGQVIASFVRERLEWGPTGNPSGIPGTPLASRVVPDAEPFNLAAVVALRKVDPGYHGPACVDLMCEEGRVPQVTEINAGRLTTLACLAHVPEVNLPDLYVKAWAGEPYTVRGPFDSVDKEIYVIRNRDGRKIGTREEIGL